MEMTDVMDIIATVASDITTETDAWANSLNNSAASAKSAGFSFADLNVIFGSMVQGGADVNSLWAAFNSAMVNMQSPTKQGADALKSVGLTLEEMTAVMGDPVNMLQFLKRGFTEAEKSGKGFAFLADLLGRQAAPEFALALGLSNEEIEEMGSLFSDVDGRGANLVNRIRES